MKVSTAIFFAVLVVASAKEESEKEKRGAIAYTTPRAYQVAAAASPDVAYATAKVSPQTFVSEKESYSQPQYQTVKYTQAQAAPVNYQQQYQYEQAYVQPQVTKLAPAKIAYTSSAAAAPAPAHYSLASDVSSFSYNSPLVAYNNLGLLSQALGKVSTAQAQQQSAYAVAPQQVQYTSKLAYTNVPQKVTYESVPQQKVTYTSIPQEQKVAYTYEQKAAPQPTYKYVTAAPQKIAYVAAPQQQHQQQVEYTSKSAAPQVTYITLPQKAYQGQVAYSQAPQVSYQSAPQEQYVYSQAPQQHYEKATAYVAQPQHAAYAQQQYSGAHSIQQPVYIIPQQHQQAFYTNAAKHPNPGVTYA